MEKPEAGNDKIHLYLFGSPRLVKSEETIKVDTRKAIALSAYLMLGKSGFPGSFSRDTLAAMFYPEADQAGSRSALRRTISTLRKALGGECLKTEREQVQLDLSCLWVDVQEFHSSLDKTRTHGHSPKDVCPACIPLLERCAQLAGQGFMAGFSLRDSPDFDDWQTYQAEALHQELASVLEKLCQGLAAQGEFDLAVAYARRWLALDPLQEEAHRQIIRLFIWKGQRSTAVRQYRECVRILEQELGVPALEETTRLYQDLLENRLPPLPILVENRPAGDEPRPHAGAIGPPPAGDKRRVSGRGSEYPLVGRAQSLEAIQKSYHASANTCFLFVLEGEAGIGKSRLAHEFIYRVKAGGAPVLQARCYEGQTGLAYAPFLDGLNLVLSSELASERLGGISEPALSLAAQLAPALLDYFPGLTPAAAPESPGAQSRFFDALRQVVGALLAPRAENELPGVIFLDDLQWSDEASLDLLAYLVRRLEGVFLLATWRSDAVPPDHRLRHLLAQNEREGRGAIETLTRLRPEEVAEMVPALPAGLPQDFLEHLYQETEGNPFFIVEYLESLHQNIPDEEKPEWEIPAGVRGLLQARMDKVGDLGRQLLSAAAVLGSSFDDALLKEVSGRSEVETVEGLEILLLQGMLVEQEARQKSKDRLPGFEISYDFSHDKLRSLAYGNTSLARRRLLHQRAAEVLARRSRLKPEEAALAASHYQEAGLISQAGEWFQQAGEYARSLYANREAISHFQNALACGYPEAARLHEDIGDLHMMAGGYLAALESYQTAAALCTPEHLPWIEHKLGKAYEQRGERDLAECYFKSALEYLDERPAQAGSVAAERAMILSDWSRTAYRQGNLPQALELASQAVGLAETCQEGQALAQAFNNLGMLARAAGSYPEALQHLKRSLEISESMADLGLRAAALNNLARVYAESGQLNDATQLTLQALEICQQRGDRHREAALYANLADLYHTQGQEEPAMQHMTKSAVIMAQIGGEPLGKPQPEIWKLVEW